MSAPVTAAVATLLLGCLLAAARGSDLPPLQVRGARIVDADDRPVTLRGCNLGGWLLIEPWMLGVHDERIRDQHDFITALVERCGAERARACLDTFRANWITPRELAAARSFGFNLVRVPFDSRLLIDDARSDETGDAASFGRLGEPLPDKLRPDAFRWLDRAVDLAADAGLYVILDMHGAPGGQSNDAPTGRRNVNALWTDPANVRRTAWLWREIAARYRERNAVLAYDLLNEPWGDFKTDVRAPLAKIVDEIYRAIRSVDSEKLLWAPGTLRGITFYGQPRDRGWHNVGFTEHFYPGLFGQGSPSLETHARFLNQVVPARRALLERLDVPYLAGEFNVTFDAAARPEMLRRYYDDFAAAGWLATMWSLRLVSNEGGVRPDFWGLVTNAAPFRLPDLHTAGCEELERAFAALGTMELAVDERVRAALTAAQAPALPLAGDGAGNGDAADFAAGGKRAASPFAGWTAIDIGTATPGGVQQLASDTIALAGAGGDIWDTHDEFHYFYKAPVGDVAVRARLTDFVAPSAFAKAGWMLRAGLEPDAAHVFVHAFPDGRVMLAWRAERGGPTREQTLAIVGQPVGLGLEHGAGGSFATYTDIDGHWQRVPVSAGMRWPETVYVGLVAHGHDQCAPARATFAGIDSTAEVPPAAWPPKAAATPPAANLLRNSSFEDAGEAADRAQHWERWGPWFNRETGWQPRRDGDALLGYHHWQVERAESSGVWQDVTGLAPGTRCTFEVLAGRDAVAAGKSGPQSVELRIESRMGGRLLNVASQTWRAADIASPRGEQSSSFAVPGSATVGQSSSFALPWSRLSVAGTLPADNARVLIIVNPSGAGPRDAALKFDSAVLRVQPATGTTCGPAAHTTRTASLTSRLDQEERK